MRLIRLLTAAAVVALGATVLATGGPAAAATTPPLRFFGAQYDSPGTDSLTNAQLDKEWIELINSGPSAVNLKGYTIRDKANHVYTFGAVSIAGKGGKLILHTGAGTANATNRYWGSKAYIWNNDGDTAYLRNAHGTQLDTCTWGFKSGRSYIAC